ncbi:MAG: NRDE family protein [Alphaproteobacteria bacterium]|nr:NRDE family protein [Alphaproteobacteria bacterium]
MCTVVILRRSTADWPVILGANRDEALARPWAPPGRHWPDRADVIAGLDKLAGGTWMGLNDHGVVACILNRHGTLGPAAGKRSRGELVLEALDHADARDATDAIRAIDPAAYRPFNMVIADNRDAYWVALRDVATSPSIEDIPAGLSMLTAGDLNDAAERRIASFRPRFIAADIPDPGANRWDAWRKLMSARGSTLAPEDAMTFLTPAGFGTSSSSLLALPSPATQHDRGVRPVWLFAAGPPDQAHFQQI